MEKQYFNSAIDEEPHMTLRTNYTELLLQIWSSNACRSVFLTGLPVSRGVISNIKPKMSCNKYLAINTVAEHIHEGYSSEHRHP